MKINKINISMSRSIQMRQFEPAQIMISAEAQVDPNDDPDAVIEQVKKRVRKAVEEEEYRLKKKRIESVEDPMEKSL